MKSKKIIFLLISLIVIFSIANIVNAATYEYDQLGRLVKVDYNEDKKANYSYDAGGNIKKVNGFSGAGESTTEPPVESTTEISTETSTETTTEVVSENKYIWNYSNDENTEKFFSVSAKNWSNAVPVSYADLSLTKAVKMESSSLISFNSPQTGKLTLVTYSTKAEPTVIINGVSYPVSANGSVEIEIPSSDTYTITKGSTNTYLYYMSFSYEVSAPIQYIWNYTNNTNTEDFYSVTANAWNSAKELVYNDMALNKAIKMESNTKISFKNEKGGIITLITYSTKDKPNIVINGKSYEVSANGKTEIELSEGGEYNITKGSTNTYLYYMEFVQK